MSLAAPDEVRPLAAPKVQTAEDESFGLSTSGFALLALCAIVAAKGIAAALPGTATGIAEVISAAVWFAACASQLVAAGGIALCIRLLGNVFALPSLGIAFRVLMLPAGFCMVALVAASATRPLDADLGKVLALFAVITPAALLPLVFARRALNEIAIALALATGAGALELVIYEVSRRSGSSDGFVSALSLLLTYLAVGCDVGAAVFATRSLSTNWRSGARSLTIAAFATALALGLGRLGASHTATSALVLAERLIEALSARRFPAIPAVFTHIASLFGLWLGAANLRKPRFRTDVRAALSLMLLARTCAAAPIGGLLSFTSALLLARAVTDPHLLPEQQSAKPVN